jgi:tRNA(fMet)-specific endonuclease VapC
LPLDSSASVDQRISIIEKRVNLTTVTILEATIETTDVFGLIMASLRKSGNPIPINDVWIAAHGLETGSILVTYDDHFAMIPGLRLWPEIGH